jgi:purine nucleosidase
MKLLIDCDPGIDDAIALTMAFRNLSTEILGVTTIFGNGGLAQTTRNAQYILERLGAGCKVASGASQALLTEYSGNGARVHGNDGMGDALDLPHMKALSERNEAITFLVNTIHNCKEPVTIVALGALTNLALFCKVAPELVSKVARVVIMGGTFREKGNIRPHAEANIYNDPHAAQIVISANWPVFLVPLDATKQVVIDGAQFDAALRGKGDGFLDKLVMCTRVYRNFHQQKYGFDGFFCHDPTALISVLTPNLFVWHEQCIEVVLEKDLLGSTQFVETGQRVMIGELTSPSEMVPNILKSLTA